MELEARKADFIRDVLMNVEDVELLDKLSKYLQRNLKRASNAPCRYTTEEIERILDAGMEDIKAGNVVTHDEMVRDVFNRFK